MVRILNDFFRHSDFSLYFKIFNLFDLLYFLLTNTVCRHATVIFNGDEFTTSGQVLQHSHTWIFYQYISVLRTQVTNYNRYLYWTHNELLNETGIRFLMPFEKFMTVKIFNNEWKSRNRCTFLLDIF